MKFKLIFSTSLLLLIILISRLAIYFSSGHISYNQAKNPVLVIFALLALGIWQLMTKNSKNFNNFPILLILIGGLANIVDLIQYKAIADYIQLPTPLSWFPAFNLADVLITIGSIWLIVTVIRVRTSLVSQY